MHLNVKVYLFRLCNRYSDCLFFVDRPTLQIDSMFWREKPFSLLKMSNVAAARVAVMSVEVMMNSNVGFTLAGYWLSSAFCTSKAMVE